MNNSATPPLPRSAYLGGLAIAIGGAVLFSTKAVEAQLIVLRAWQKVASRPD